MVICLERGAIDLHDSADATATPSSLASVKSRMVYILLIQAKPGCPGKKAVKRLCVCVSLFRH